MQGFGAALMSPAALALVITAVPAPGASATTALGIWGALAGLGGTVGVVAGGVLVDAVGWEWVFFVNVPIAVAVLPFVAAPRAGAARGSRRGAGLTTSPAR